jgi:hypothetical protein
VFTNNGVLVNSITPRPFGYMHTHMRTSGESIRIVWPCSRLKVTSTAPNGQLDPSPAVIRLAVEPVLLMCAAGDSLFPLSFSFSPLTGCQFLNTVEYEITEGIDSRCPLESGLWCFLNNMKLFNAAICGHKVLCELDWFSAGWMIGDNLVRPIQASHRKNLL